MLCDKGRIFLTFRYWSVQIISEKGRETRTLVPCPWVDNINEIIYWPPKGNHLEYIWQTGPSQEKTGNHTR